MKYYFFLLFILLNSSILSQPNESIKDSLIIYRTAKFRTTPSINPSNPNNSYINQRTIKERYDERFIITDKLIIDSINNFINVWGVSEKSEKGYKQGIFILIEFQNNHKITISPDETIQYNNSVLFKDSMFIDFLINEIPELDVDAKLVFLSDIERESFNSIDLIFDCNDLGILPSKFFKKKGISNLYIYISKKILNPNLSLKDYDEDVVLMGDWILSHKELIEKEEITYENVHLYNHPFYNILKQENAQIKH